MKPKSGLCVALACLLQPLAVLAEDPGAGTPGGFDSMLDDLPLPFGVSVLYLWQEQEYDVTGLRASAGGFPVPGFGPAAIPRIENEVQEVNAKFDWWALPWLNLHAVFGGLDGQADADLAPFIRPLLGGVGRIEVDYDGIVYGGGITVAGGYGNFFASLTANYTWADVDLEDGLGLSLDDPNGIETLVVVPRIGWRFERGAIWAGGYYQFTEHTQSGSFRLPPPIGTIQFQADVEDEAPWSYVVGGEYRISDQWILSAEIGFGDRTQVLLGTSYRF